MGFLFYQRVAPARDRQTFAHSVLLSAGARSNFGPWPECRGGTPLAKVGSTGPPWPHGLAGRTCAFEQ
eukprot:6705210-Lingulodinium_polyedra.AAC.1